MGFDITVGNATMVSLQIPPQETHVDGGYRVSRLARQPVKSGSKRFVFSFVSVN